MVDYLDADLVNADWPKQTWDLGGVDEINAMPIESLQHLTTLPAWEAAPPAVRKAGEERLAAVADD